MYGEEELILGSCNLPFEDDSSMVIVNTQYHLSDESEIITGDIGDFPVPRDHDQDQNGSRPIESPAIQIKMEEEEEEGGSSTPFKALENNCELAFPDSICLPSAGQLNNASTLNPTKIFTNESSATTFNNGSEKQRSYNPEEFPFSCPSCSRKFMRRYNLDRHMDTCNGFPDVICLPSTGHFHNPSTRNSTVNTKSKTFLATDNKKGKHGSERSTQCSQEFNAEKQKRSNAEAPQFSCGVCSKKFARKYTRDCHMRKASCKTKSVQPPTLKKKTEFKQTCPFCSYWFKNSCQLRDHVINVHKKSITYICPICQKSVTVFEDLVERHFSDHVSNLECTTCELKFQSREKLDAHIETESLGKDHLKCLDCQSTFCKWIDFFTHIIEHLPAGDCRNPVACNVCKLRLGFTKDFLNHLTGVGIKTSTHESDSDIEWIDNKKEEYEIVLISDDDDVGDHNAESKSDKTPAQSSGAHSPDLQSTVGPIYTMQSSGGQSSDVPSMSQGTLRYVPQIFLLPAMDMAPNIVSSAGPNLLPPVTSVTVVAQSAITAATSTTVSQPTSEEKLVSMECIKPDLTDDSFPEDQKENMQDGENDSTPQLRLQNVYSLAGSVPPFECTEDGIVSNNTSESSEAETGCLRHCRFCWQRLEDLESLRRHESNHTIRRTRYACLRCYRLFTKKGTMQKHFDAKRCASVPSSTFTCKECGALFSYKIHLMEHYMTAHSQPSSVLTTCPICKIILSQGSSLDSHLEVVHKLRLESIGGGMTVLRDILPTSGT